jgi:hypothetical protein
MQGHNVQVSDEEVPAGWYPEAPGSAVERLWTGSAWTEYTRPRGRSVSPEESTKPAQVTPERTELRSDRVFSPRFWFTLVAVCLVFGGVLFGMLSSVLGSGSAATVSDACDSAGQEAVKANQAIYDKEGALLDEIDADGIRTSDEDARWLALYADTSAEYVALLAPTFSDCTTKDEWMVVAKRYPDFVGSTRADAVTESTLINFCSDFIDSPVCVDAAAQGLEITR